MLGQNSCLLGRYFGVSCHVSPVHRLQAQCGSMLRQHIDGFKGTISFISTISLFSFSSTWLCKTMPKSSPSLLLHYFYSECPKSNGICLFTHPWEWESQKRFISFITCHMYLAIPGQPGTFQVRALSSHHCCSGGLGEPGGQTMFQLHKLHSGKFARGANYFSFILSISHNNTMHGQLLTCMSPKSVLTQSVPAVLLVIVYSENTDV